jgi:malate dehydrogenase (oxaloacetate-decarboxylating)(NADP+)
VFIADTSVLELPSPSQLADIAEEAAGVARRFGHTPRVALLSYSTFGHPKGDRVKNSRDAVAELDRRKVSFEYDGEMAADVALSRSAMALYPFCRLSAPANVLVMPAAHSASISTKMLQQLGGVTVIGPLLAGLDKPVQIASMSATASDILNLAAVAAFDING